MNTFAVIVAAAGSGTRFQSGNQKKTYALLAGKPVWCHSVERFAARDDVKQILIVVSPEDVEWFSGTYAAILNTTQSSVVAGGSERFASVENALRMVDPQIEYVAVHDAARPTASSPMLERVFAGARINGNAIPACPVSSTLKRSVDGSQVVSTVDRSELFESQTPQIFRTKELKEAYDQIENSKPTDEAQLMESIGHTVFSAEGCPLNRKITTQQDLQFAEAALKAISGDESAPIHFDGPDGDTRLC